jgi:phenylpropionate dioxygenase-like ring-hydroxylating dioxygenase large terminal subunit
VGEVPAARYSSRDWFDRERATLFARLPQVVAAESDLAEIGATLATEIASVPVIVARGSGDALGCFRNACRHRSTALVPAGELCKKKAFVCPYHGWTYDLSGALVHVPHESTFHGRCEGRRALAPAFAAARHGLVFAGLDRFDLDAHVGMLDRDIEALGVSDWVTYRRSTHDVAANWKLIIDAFLDGYHVRHLHRDTLYRFFLDACFASEPVGPHIRSVVARRPLLESSGELPSGSSLRELVTISYLVFPNTILIAHSDYLNVLTCFPVAPNRTKFEHRLLIPSLPTTAEEESHWQRSFDLIDGQVFAREDLWVAEQAQRGIESGANDRLLFGTLERGALWFHESVAKWVGE